jgi:hypothetical protein
MALPASLGTTTVNGTYVDLLGNPVRGSVTFTPQTILKEKAANVIIIPTAIVKTLDSSGSLTITLPVSNDTDVVPQPFIYTVTENFTGGRTLEISLPVDASSGTLNLADLLSAVSPAEAASYTTYAQYEALEGRYDLANTRKVIVVNASNYVDNAATYAAQASASNSAVTDFTSRSLMLMGV